MNSHCELLEIQSINICFWWLEMVGESGRFFMLPCFLRKRHFIWRGEMKSGIFCGCRVLVFNFYKIVNDILLFLQFQTKIMTKQSILLLLFVFAFRFCAAAVTVKGVVIDKTGGQPLEYATVQVYSQPDKAFVNGVITDTRGKFELKLEKGTYLFEIQFIGYISVNKEVSVSGSKPVVDMGKIQLLPDHQLLDEVSIVAEASTYEMTLDKRVFNVGKDVSATAGNAIEVLENIPAVSVDVEGNVSLRGDEGVRILIDGKESGLSGMNTQDALRTVQADMIERVEVITNPSVRYDAEGSAGIINIILKKDFRKGFNAAVNVRAGYPWQAGVGLSANYRIKRFNFFASYNYNFRSNVGGGYTSTKRFDINPLNGDTIYTQLTEQNTDRTMLRNGHNARIGTDFYVTDNDIISLAFVFRHSTSRTNPIVAYNDMYPLADSLSLYDERKEKWQEKEPAYELTLDYDKMFDRKGQSLKASVRYFYNSELSNSDITEFVYPNSDKEKCLSELFQKTKADETQHNVQATFDYVHPFATKAVWEIGAKYTCRGITSVSGVTQLDEDSVYVRLPDYSYDFSYREQVAALYTSIGNDWGRWSGQIGVRAEMTDIRTVLRDYGGTGIDSINGGKPYVNLFPSAHLNYSFNETNQLQLSYTRRIRRPGYWEMSPFRSYNDNRNIRMGNPSLKPVFMDSFEFGYIHFWDKATFTFTTYYRHGTNTKRHYTYLVDSVYYSMPINFGKSNDFGVEAVVQGNVTKWWNLNGNVNFFRSHSKGSIDSVEYVTKSWMCFLRVVSKFSIKKWFDFQITGHYHAPHEEPLGHRDGEWWIDMAVSKDLFHGNGTITFNVRDVFGTRGHGGDSWGDNFVKYSTSTWNKTSFQLNFSYRINQQQGTKRDKRNMGGDDDGGEGDEGEY